QGKAHGTWYEDDGTTPDYEQGAFSRTTIEADGAHVHVARTGSWQPPAHRTLFSYPAFSKRSRS
ncbi:MAG TPA: DUF5110 domain-containing protein, partial [Candidatus Xenobia bacterium]